MRTSQLGLFIQVSRSYSTARYGKSSSSLPILRIDNATFYRRYPSVAEVGTKQNPKLFPGLNFVIPSDLNVQEKWAIVGPSNAGKTTFFQILRGQYFCSPPQARSNPCLSAGGPPSIPNFDRNPARAIQYVGFNAERGGLGRQGTRGAYLSARYESRREETDFSVLSYLKGDTALNATKELGEEHDEKNLDRAIQDLSLQALVNMPMRNLSNGQTRRAKIARALLGKPMVLLLDEPFMGLDPPTVTAINPLLQKLAIAGSPRLILALRPQDPLPDWISHLIVIGPNFQISYQGNRRSVPYDNMGAPLEGSYHLGNRQTDTTQSSQNSSQVFSGMRGNLKHGEGLSREGLPLQGLPAHGKSGETLVDMQNVIVRYGERLALGDWKQDVDGKEREGLWWRVRRGERWGVFGPNGSGKTTLLSLICSDHPHAYSLPIQIFGRGRLPRPGQPGISIFDIQARIGQSSPEIHAFFPRHLTLRQTIENAWADTFLGTPKLSHQNRLAVELCLRWFETELNPACRSPDIANTVHRILPAQTEHDAVADLSWADDVRFGDAPFSTQRVALLLRAIVKKPDLVVLDEAFSGMDTNVRDKCMLFLTWGQTRSYDISIEPGSRIVKVNAPTIPGQHVFEGLTEEQALICVSHERDEVPGVVRDWMKLPESTLGVPPRFGIFHGPLEGNPGAWNYIWDAR